MKQVTKTYNVYSFDELSEEAQNKAISELIEFYIEVIPYEEMSSSMKRACNKAEQMQTPWFVGSYIYDYCKAELVDELMEQSFLESGEIFIEDTPKDPIPGVDYDPDGDICQDDYEYFTKTGRYAKEG